jgi:hypothetical protein
MKLKKKISIQKKDKKQITIKRIKETFDIKIK